MRGTVAFLLALAAAANLALSGCAPAWPDVRAIGEPAFLAGARSVATVDLLPIDVTVASDGQLGTAEEIAAVFENAVTAQLVGALASRGYQLAAVIDGEGGYVRSNGQPGVAMSHEEIDRTLQSLASYGFAESRAAGRLLTPLLPARLGVATGSDASLYIGGYGYSGEDPSGVDAGDVVKGVLVALVIVAVVVVLVAATKHGGGVGGGGNVAHALPAMHGAAHLGHAMVHAGRPLVDLVDVFGRVGTHVDVSAAHADEMPAVPQQGDSQTLVEMTLIDNHTGQTLWHARQRFPANPARQEHIAELVSRMLGTLPPRR